MVLRDDYSFTYEYTYQDVRCSEMIMVLLINILTRTMNTYIIRTLSTKHAVAFQGFPRIKVWRWKLSSQSGHVC